MIAIALQSYRGKDRKTFSKLRSSVQASHPYAYAPGKQQKRTVSRQRGRSERQVQLSGLYRNHSQSLPHADEPEISSEKN
jgi:hypothetical protein